MPHHTIEFDEQCKSCKGTGLYVGLAERDGAAVVCTTCKGTGCHHMKIEYDDFTGKKPIKGIKRVFQVNPGIVIGEEKGQCKLSDFGGMPYKDWAEKGEGQQQQQFAPQTEMRQFTCPAWWYQWADYDLKPQWDDEHRSCMMWGGAFSSCPHFGAKQGCWQRWDKENNQQ
jgi:hypothetical protein